MEREKKEKEADKKEHLNNRRLSKKNGNKSDKRILIWTGTGIAAVFLIVGIAWLILSMIGEKNMLAAEKKAEQDVNETDTEPRAAVSQDTLRYTELTSLDDFGKEKWNEGILKYKDKYYRYNERLQNYLFMGIDNDEPAAPADNSLEGGQSDAMFLLVLDEAAEKMKIIAINRNTMVPVDVYDEDGNFMLQMELQICTAHGYGDGMKLSCMRTVEAVDRLFRDIPISGYLALNMGGLPALNDAIGGIRLTPIESIDWRDAGIKEGEEITLNGKQAYAYVRYRDINEFATADQRLKRQEQYIDALINKLHTDPSLAGKMINESAEYIVASIDLPKIANSAGNMSFGDDDKYSVPGETELKDGYERYNIDREAMIELILDVFYEQV